MPDDRPCIYEQISLVYLLSTLSVVASIIAKWMCIICSLGMPIIPLFDPFPMPPLETADLKFGTIQQGMARVSLMTSPLTQERRE